MCERQADNHTGQDAVAIAGIPMARKYIQNIIIIQILEYATKQMSYSLYNFKDHIVFRICDEYIAPQKYYGAEEFVCSYSRNLIYIPEN
jgi:hypothetical protein